MNDSTLTSNDQPSTAERRGHDLETRGRRWVLWSFLFCPCHLPLTITVLATALGSTAAGAALRGNSLAVGLGVTVIWIAGTWRGLAYVRRADACRVPAAGARRSRSRRTPP